MQLASYYSYRFSYYTPQSYKNIALTGLNTKIVDANFLSLAACQFHRAFSPVDVSTQVGYGT